MLLTTDWNTLLMANGSHTVRAVKDTVTPALYSEAKVFVVNNGNVPEFILTNPAPGETLDYPDPFVVNAEFIVTNGDGNSVWFNLNGAGWNKARIPLIHRRPWPRPTACMWA